MGQLSPILRDGEDGRLFFWCPGCDGAHAVTVGDGPGPPWTWNGDAVRPTFAPSLLIRSGHYVSWHKPGDPCWCSYSAAHPDKPAVFGCGVCHSFVVAGRIQFLGDCTHALAGQTVDLPPWDEERSAGK